MDKQTNQAKMPRKSGPMGRGGSGEKAKDFKTAMKKLIRYSKPFWPAILVAVVLAIGSSILTIVGPNQISRITDEITKGLASQIDVQKVTDIAILVGVLYILSGILGYIQSFIMATITQKFSKKMRNEISVKINHLPLKYFDHHSYGDTLSRVTNDVDTIRNFDEPKCRKSRFSFNNINWCYHYDACDKLAYGFNCGWCKLIRICLHVSNFKKIAKIF